MRYPLGLPKELQRPIEVARDKAEMLLLEALSNKTAHRLNEAFNFISRVFPAFAHQACEAERQGNWLGHEGREAVETFLEWQLIPHAYELARVSQFIPAPIHSPLSLDAFRHRVMEFIEQSDLWRAYLAERGALREPSALAESAAALAAAGRTPNSAPSSLVDVADATPIVSVPDQTAASAQFARAEARSTVLEPLLRDRGWSTEDWAQKANVDFHTPSDYLKGLTKPRRDTLKKLADALGVAVTSMPE